MAACCRTWARKLFLLNQTSMHELHHSKIIGCQVQQVRYRNKGPGRTKAPHVAKEKVKWVSREVKKNKSVIPNNWDKFLQRVPEDDVWIRMHYPRPQYSFSSIVEMHRELAQPAMMDNMQGMLNMHVVLDMRTTKKTKFISAHSRTIPLPYTFDDGLAKKVMAFCKTADDKDIAIKAGATYAGGIDLIKTIEKGDITAEDFDHVVSTIDILPDLAKVRKFLKGHFPQRSKENLGVDIDYLVNRFRYGQTYEFYKTEDAVAKVDVMLGQLDMPMEHLEANFHAFIEAFWTHSKNRTPSLGPFVKSALISCPPSPEYLMLVNEELLPLSKRQQAVADELEEEQQEATA